MCCKTTKLNSKVKTVHNKVLEQRVDVCKLTQRLWWRRNVSSGPFKVGVQRRGSIGGGGDQKKFWKEEEKSWKTKFSSVVKKTKQIKKIGKCLRKYFREDFSRLNLG